MSRRPRVLGQDDNHWFFAVPDDCAGLRNRWTVYSIHKHGAKEVEPAAFEMTLGDARIVLKKNGVRIRKA